MKKVLKILLFLVIIAALAVLGIKLIHDKRAKEASLPPAKIYPIVVKTMVPKAAEDKLTLPSLAQTVNETDVTLSSRIASRVEQIVKSGMAVKKGDVVAKLDTTDITANTEALKVALSNLLKSHKRTQALYRVKGASIEQLQKEQSEIASLKAKLKAVENQLSYATITAPISGIVAKTFAAVGDVTMPGKPMVQISAESGFSLLVRTPQDIVPKAVLFGGKEYALHALNSTFNGLNEYKAYVKDSHGLSAGERVEVNVVVFEGKAIELPFDAVLNREGKSYVLVVSKDRAVPKEIHIVQSAEQGVVISDDLSGKKIVVAKPDILLKLTSGYVLKVKE
ncbi:efflux RND transporter periplasmic adaptor subunit [Sulfurovum sp.]|uniref:efflux RND transporter periplasmic adaptor subunit n=1 Tax=Sulfurovum sp. TaxID=1969726 RepID=UPI0025D3401A|nr:efflux RND transporter periplasmic adaptor subunit [Sulfurovum sp.]